jgi:EARP and GARP complex-interacting protein 1
MQVWQLQPGAGPSSSPLSVSSLELSGAAFIGGCAWDPHKAGTDVAIASDSSVLFWDLRSSERPRSISHAVPSGSCVRALSYNPNKQYHLATGGDDFRVKIWDLRKTSSPVKILDGHTHWYASVTLRSYHLFVLPCTSAAVNHLCVQGDVRRV